MFKFKCYSVEFSSQFDSIQIVHRITGNIAKELTLSNGQIEVVSDAANDTVDIRPLDTEFDPPIEIAIIDTTQEASIEVNSEFYGGIGESDIRDLRVSNVFLLRNGRLTFEFQDPNIIMRGKANDASLPFYSRLDRTTSESDISVCPLPA